MRSGKSSDHICWETRGLDASSNQKTHMYHQYGAASGTVVLSREGRMRIINGFSNGELRGHYSMLMIKPIEEEIEVLKAEKELTAEVAYPLHV